MKNILKNNQTFRKHLGKQIVSINKNNNNFGKEHWLISLETSRIHKTDSLNQGIIDIMFSRKHGIFYKDLENSSKPKIVNNFPILLLNGSEFQIIDGQMA